MEIMCVAFRNSDDQVLFRRNSLPNRRPYTSPLTPVFASTAQQINAEIGSGIPLKNAYRNARFALPMGRRFRDRRGWISDPPGGDYKYNHSITVDYKNTPLANTRYMTKRR